MNKQGSNKSYKEGLYKKAGKRLKNELLIIRELRKDSRQSHTDIAKKTGLSVSTVKEKIKRLEKKGVIRYVSLLDFQGLNLMSVLFLINGPEQELKEVENSRFVNTAFRINNGFKLYLECVFPSVKEYFEFKQKIRRKGLIFVESLVIDDILREEFMPSISAQ